jgi:hypothetical protein
MLSHNFSRSACTRLPTGCSFLCLSQAAAPSCKPFDFRGAKQNSGANPDCIQFLGTGQPVQSGLANPQGRQSLGSAEQKLRLGVCSGNCEAIRHVLCLFLKRTMNWRDRAKLGELGESAEEHCRLFLPRKQHNVPERYLLRDREA